MFGTFNKIRLAAIISIFFLSIIAYMAGQNMFFGKGNNEAPARLLNNLFTECELRKGDRQIYYDCLRKGFAAMFKKTPVQNAMAAFSEFVDNRITQDGSRNAQCHDEMHIFGEEAARNYGNISVVRECSPACGYGCPHGALSYALRASPDVLYELSSVCEPFERSSFPGQGLTACNHGLGHGIADLGNREIVSALKLCDYLNIDARTECATGVFMEIYDSPVLNQPAQQYPDDVPAFCESLPENYRHVCFNTAGGYEFKKNKNIETAFNACESVPAEFLKGCVVGLGSDLHFLLAGNAEAIYSNCLKAGNQSTVGKCIIGSLNSRFVTDRRGESWSKLCDIAGPQYKEACFNYVGLAVNEIYGAEVQRQYCGSLGNLEKSYCLKE